MGGSSEFGFKQMILYTSIIIVAFIIAVFFVIRMAKDFRAGFNTDNNKQNSPTYEQMERDLESAALKYVELYYEEEQMTNGILVKIDSLIQNNMVSRPKDEKDNRECTGYVLVSNMDYVLEATAFLKCSNYITSGYQEHVLEN